MNVWFAASVVLTWMTMARCKQHLAAWKLTKPCSFWKMRKKENPNLEAGLEGRRSFDWRKSPASRSARFVSLDTIAQDWLSFRLASAPDPPLSTRCIWCCVRWRCLETRVFCAFLTPPELRLSSRDIESDRFATWKFCERPVDKWTMRARATPHLRTLRSAVRQRLPRDDLGSFPGRRAGVACRRFRRCPDWSTLCMKVTKSMNYSRLRHDTVLARQQPIGLSSEVDWFLGWRDPTPCLARSCPETSGGYERRRERLIATRSVIGKN